MGVRDIFAGDDGRDLLGTDACSQWTGCFYPRGFDVRDHYDGQCLVSDSSRPAQDDRRRCCRRRVRSGTRRSGQAALQAQYLHGSARGLSHDQQSFSCRNLWEQVWLGDPDRSRPGRLGGGKSHSPSLDATKSSQSPVRVNRVQASRDKRDRATAVIARCQTLARFSEDSGRIRRTFLSPPMRECHREIAGWVAPLGVTSRVDAVGNLRMLYPASKPDAPHLMIGSHLDTVPNAGAYDGVLGVVLPIARLIDLNGRNLPFAIEVGGLS